MFQYDWPFANRPQFNIIYSFSTRFSMCAFAPNSTYSCTMPLHKFHLRLSHLCKVRGHMHNVRAGGQVTPPAFRCLLKPYPRRASPRPLSPARRMMPHPPCSSRITYSGQNLTLLFNCNQPDSLRVLLRLILPTPALHPCPIPCPLSPARCMMPRPPCSSRTGHRWTDHRQRLVSPRSACWERIGRGEGTENM